MTYPFRYYESEFYRLLTQIAGEETAGCTYVYDYFEQRKYITTALIETTNDVLRIIKANQPMPLNLWATVLVLNFDVYIQKCPFEILQCINEDDWNIIFKIWPNRKNHPLYKLSKL